MKQQQPNSKDRKDSRPRGDASSRKQGYRGKTFEASPDTRAFQLMADQAAMHRAHSPVTEDLNQSAQAESHENDGIVQRKVHLISSGASEVDLDKVKKWLDRASSKMTTAQELIASAMINSGEIYRFNWAYGQRDFLDVLNGKRDRHDFVEQEPEPIPSLEEQIVEMFADEISNVHDKAGQFAADAVIAAVRYNTSLHGKALEKAALRIIKIYERVFSVLRNGVLTPKELKQKQIGHTPSSDPESLGNKISGFDIDLTRNSDEHYGERFTHPGHQSLNPVVERQSDIWNLGVGTVKAAAKGKEAAIENVEALQKELGNTDDLKTFLAAVKKNNPMIFRLGEIARFSDIGTKGLEERAAGTAMVVSSGDALANSRIAKQKWLTPFGPKVTELRSPVGIEPEALTHVILPQIMEYFGPVADLPGEIIFVGNVTSQVGYYDANSRVSKQIQLEIPDYQGAIEQLLKSNQKLVTHITNV